LSAYEDFCESPPPPGLTRRSALTVLGAAAALPLWPMFEAASAPLSYSLEPQKLTDGVWMLAGANEPITRTNGGAIANIAILDTRDGAIVVDTGPSRRYGEALRSLAESLTGKPVVRALVTHFHPDHVFGNQAFATDVLAAPRGVVDGLKRSGEDFATAMYHLTGDWMRGTELTLPEKIVETGYEDIGERRLRYIVLSGHTDTDLAIFDEHSGILFGGDLVFLDRAPTTPHADLPNWHASLSVLAEMPFRQLMPGHGPTQSTGGQGIKQTGDWLKVVNETITNAFERGLAMTEAMSEPLPEWTNEIALARYEFGRSVMHIYPKLEAGNWPRVDN